MNLHVIIVKVIENISKELKLQYSKNDKKSGTVKIRVFFIKCFNLHCN